MSEKANTCVYQLLTPPGRSAVATIRICGRDLKARLSELFQPKNVKSFECFSNSTFVYGLWQSGEDVVLDPIDSERADIHCHGGIAAVEMIGKSLRAAGFGESDEFSRLLGGSPWRCQLQQAIADTITKNAARWLLKQYHLCDQVLERWMAASDRVGVVAEIDQSLAWYDFGRHLVEPYHVVLTGAPNAGKSSLINALLGFERAIVHGTPGTTRDVVSQTTAFQGWPLSLRDTAGIRSASDGLESQGIEAARRQLEQADLIVYTVDATRMGDGGDWRREWEARESVEWEQPRRLWAFNKVDLLSENERSQLQSEFATVGELGNCFFVSAKTREGIVELVEGVARSLVPDCPPDNVLFPFDATTYRWLRQLRCGLLFNSIG